MNIANVTGRVGAEKSSAEVSGVFGMAGRYGRRRMKVLPALSRLMVWRLRWLLACGDQRDAEILALRHQLLVLQRQVVRPAFTEADRTILAVLSTVFDRQGICAVFLIVKPATVIGWHRRLVARHWTQPNAPKPGRPAVHAEIRRLAVVMAVENPTWGYRCVHGELCRLGYKVAASSVWKVLRTAGVDPTPNRTGPSWTQFIRSQAKAVIATDFAASTPSRCDGSTSCSSSRSGRVACISRESRPTRPGRGPPNRRATS